jgi:hypothetical protein
MEERFNKSSCSSSNCSFDDVYQPVPIPPSIKFIAMSAFYSIFNNLAPNVSLLPNEDNNYELSSLNFTQINHAIEAICQQSWLDVNEPDKYRPCMSKCFIFL